MNPPLQTCCVSLGRLLCSFWAPVTIRESARTCSLRSSEARGRGAVLPLLCPLPPSCPVPAWPGTEAWCLLLQLQHWLAI